MANTRELRRRIRSVKNTAQITKAMQMVAATKMRRAQAQALSGRPYSETLTASILSLLEKINPEQHPLLSPNDSNKKEVILLTTDKGLCGALNTNLARATSQFISTTGTNSNFEFLTIGKKGRGYLIRTGKDVEADFENPDTITFRSARQLTKLIIEKYLSGEIGEAYVIFPSFISALRQEPTVIKLLPIELNELINEQTKLATASTTKSENKVEVQSGDFLFEPNPDVLLDFILTQSVETKIYQALLETKASEHSARMIAMQNATDNAKDLVDDLQLTYNQTRQDAITSQLLEITSASAALE